MYTTKNDRLQKYEGIWIPCDVASYKRLNSTEKIVLSMIISLSKNEPCYATNKYLAKCLNLSQRQVSSIINKLIKKGLVSSKVIEEEGNRRILTPLWRNISKLLGSADQDPVEETFYSDNIGDRISNKKFDNKRADAPFSEKKSKKKNDVCEEGFVFSSEEEKEKSCAKKEKEEYGELMIDLYIEFFTQRTQGLKPNLDNADRKAALDLLHYFSEQVDKSGKKLGFEQALKSFEYVLNRWDQLDRFYQSQLKLRQIYSNINNIIPQMMKRHGNSSNSKTSGSDSFTGAFDGFYSQQQP